MPIYSISKDGIYVVSEQAEDPIYQVVVPATTATIIDEDCIDAIDKRIIHAHGCAIMSERDYGCLITKICYLQWKVKRLEVEIEHGKNKEKQAG